ncbi:succinylglutamate desuccinylase/aspartoacylase family protein [Campylobacter ovis]|uniref:M99 family carboxypeptidase catalytic domain-containing protein n=1 Tax=Campylobacter sp. TaxID=205 RepID=UPI00254FC3F2|nr:MULTISPECIES: M99 family carboxypeptidase catalytic domain-containing protein [Campylobacter]MDL0105308.1 succinylglutamate desuccinylase/aspartoacylase family protein [Campylobacter ovis]MDL0106727.1 succinylglutamate desuccinylase/aspartoacylase family protein [Campylobacter ovis]
MRKIIAFLTIFIFASYAYGEFSLIKLGIDNNNTVLVTGGIQGDEPGGFMSANLLARGYEITSGSLYVAPNLNMPSIIKKSRGVNGDMNRKFDTLSEKDPEKDVVEQIKSLVLQPNITMLINLHDGSGFYRPKYINKMMNPNRWGNIAIIDQATLPNAIYGDLEATANKVVKELNKHLLDPKHKYHLRNTHTAKGDKEMLKSLSYFAIKNGKAAYANEASKTLPVHERVYYHLIAVEEYLKLAGIEFKRKFELTPQGVKKALDEDLSVLVCGKFMFYSPKSRLGYIPLSNDGELEFDCDNALVALTKNKDGYNIHYGNKIVTRFTPQFFEYSNLINEIEIRIDEGEPEFVILGQKISAKNSFEIIKRDGVRTNIIGYGTIPVDESGIKISKDMIKSRFSMDKDESIYRVEFYEETDSKDKFIGMILVEFVK